MRRWSFFFKKLRSSLNTIVFTVAVISVIQITRHRDYFSLKLHRFSNDLKTKYLENNQKISTTTTTTAFPKTFINLSNDELDENPKCFKIFLERYTSFCEAVKLKWTRKFNNVDKILRIKAEVNNSGNSKITSKQLCPCVPNDLNQYNEVSLQPPSGKQLESLKASLKPGGSWSPTECTSIQRIAVIIPFRDRREHLHILLMRLHPLLQKQLYNYTVFVVEQLEQNMLFNKAILMNSAFKHIFIKTLKPLVMRKDYDCVVFHDVDLLPLSDFNFYQCLSDQVRHVAGYVDKWNYKLLYPRIFGGGTSFMPKIFVDANGFSNLFYGWGGEDDDMLNRVEAANYTFIRYPICVSKYRMIRHEFHKNNPYRIENNIGFTALPKLHYQEDGLSSVPSKLISTEKLELYTHILISVPPPSL